LQGGEDAAGAESGEGVNGFPVSLQFPGWENTLY